MVAPGFEEGAVAILAAKKNIRLLEVEPPDSRAGLEMRAVDGGILVQSRDVVGRRPRSGRALEAGRR